jgi:hypothetical protein
MSENTRSLTAGSSQSVRAGAPSTATGGRGQHWNVAAGD